MHCASCSQENRAEASFCLACGAKLTQLCGSCGRELPPGARFCDACGYRLEAAPQPSVLDPRSYTPRHLAAKILTARSALEGERKQVTVLFADVAGSTALAETLDPEDVHGIMDRCFRLLAQEVHRYDGTVNQFTGDGIMALFGAPIAHEDAPERAVRAALGMQAALKGYHDELSQQRGIDFRMRIGINTGPVVVGKIGDDLRMDYTAIGDTTNLAARLQTAAAPGTVLISEPTAKLVSGRFVTRPVGPLVLKGKSQPVVAYEVVRVLPRTPLVAPSERGLTPLVGRVADLSTLEAAFGRARSGQGQVMFVVGEAGIGKSRLIHEFRRRIASEPVTWLQGRCISFGRGIPFLPIVDMLKGGLSIEESDDDATIIDKVHQGLQTLHPDLVASAPYLRALLAVDPGDPEVAGMDAGARRFGTFEALKRLMLAQAAAQPLVLLVEDLHWLDPASEEFLTYIVDAVAVARILLLCTHRPGYRTVLGDRSYFNRLTLQALSPDETAHMAALMLEAHELPLEIRALVAAKAEGNPFFIEEVTKTLVEMGAVQRSPSGAVLARPVSEIVIPNTIQDVIMARIDRLGDEPKRAIQIASVIGREFAVRLLQRASEVGESVNVLVGELRALELIYEKFGVPELAYMFKHALTHDVAYQSLLMQRRKELHRTIGHAIEDLYADRLSEYWETLAHHFDRAEEWPLAFEYLIKAGDKARAAFANVEAMYFYDRALAVASHLQIDATRRAAIFEGKAGAHFCLSEFVEAIDAYHAALELTPAPADRARLNAGLAECLLWAHEFDAGLAAADEAVALARSAAEPSIANDALFVIGFVRMVRGQLAEAVDCLVEVGRSVETTGQHTLGARVRMYAALRANWAGQYRGAIGQYDVLLPELKHANELLRLAEATSHFGITLGGGGHYQRAFPILTEGIALSESIGDRVWRARMWNTRGWMFCELGAWDAAEEANRRCLEIAQHLGSVRIVSELVGNARVNLADLALARGDLSAADSELAEVATILSDPRNEWMAWRYGMHFRCAAAELALARGDLATARQHLENCLAAAQRTLSPRYLVRARRLLASCHTAGGNLPEAELLLTDAVAEARVLGNPPQLWHTLLDYGRVLHARGRHAEAVALWREALGVVDAVQAGLPGDVRTPFTCSAVRRTLQELLG